LFNDSVFFFFVFVDKQETQVNDMDIPWVAQKGH